MWDKRAIVNIILLILYSAGFNFYLYELFYGSWLPVNSKAFYYLITTVSLFWLILDEYMGYVSYINQKLNIIHKLCLLLNFAIITITLYGLLNTRQYFYLYNGSIFVLSLMILTSGGRHDYFKD